VAAWNRDGWRRKIGEAIDRIGGRSAEEEEEEEEEGKKRRNSSSSSS